MKVNKMGQNSSYVCRQQLEGSNAPSCQTKASYRKCLQHFRIVQSLFLFFLLKKTDKYYYYLVFKYNKKYNKLELILIKYANFS